MFAIPSNPNYACIFQEENYLNKKQHDLNAKNDFTVFG